MNRAPGPQPPESPPSRAAALSSDKAAAAPAHDQPRDDQPHHQPAPDQPIGTTSLISSWASLRISSTTQSLQQGSMGARHSARSSPSNRLGSRQARWFGPRSDRTTHRSDPKVPGISRPIDATPREAPRPSPRPPTLARRIAALGASLALLGLGLGTLPASGQGTSTESPSTASTVAGSPGAANAGGSAIPANSNGGAPAANEPLESLSQSIQRRREFPFPARCDGNTQEMVACLWQERDRGDLRLRKLLGSEQVLERWRAARLTVCRRSSERGAGGSIQPLLWLGCENALNATLIEQITSPLLR